MRGYVPQYDFAAAVIYDAIAAGRLRWIGLADRAARNFDDLVLGLHDRTVCHQLKSRSRPERFSVRTLLLGSTALLADLVSVWSAFRNDLGGVVEVKFLTADYPDEEDSVGEPNAPSSAAFIRAMHANRSWSAGDWARSPFAAFFEELRQASGLSDDDFQSFLAHVTLGKAEDQIGYRATSIQDARRIKDIAALLPKLVADKSDKDRWTVDELLKQLDWRDPFSTKHGHSFPVDALVQENRKTQDQLQAALQNVSSGYIALVGPPGSGKSTLLQAGLLPTPRATVIRYLAFMPNEGHSLGRGEAFDFLHDLVVQLKRAGFGSSLVTGSTREELLSQFAELLREAGGKFKASGIRTIILVDGLDHIPREEKTDRPLLRELPLPVSIPDGVVFILGTQTLELDDIPPTARDQAKAAERCIPISSLSKEAIFLMADLSGLPSDCDRGTIFDRSQGHPLSTRYVIEALSALASQLGHLRATSFRRSFALATFRYQQDRLIALRRLVWQGSVGGERTPHEHIREVAEEAIGLAQLGERDRARQLLDTIHREGLGYSRAAKKDPQYVMWRDIFRRACQEDVLAIPERVAAMVRLISGLSDTEGDNAGGRVTAEVLKWATYAGAATSGPTIDALEETGLISWTEIVSSSVQGIAMRWPANARHAAIAFGRVALPFLDGVDSRAIPKLMQSASTEQLEPIARHLSACIDTDGHEGARVVHLEQIVQDALLRGLSIELEAIGRWQSEDGPPKSPGMGTDDAFANVKSITELSERLRTSDGKSSWSIAGTVRRLAPIVSHQELKALLDAHPNLLEEERILSIATLTAIREGASDVVADWAKRLAEKANEESSWGGYQSGAKTRLFMVRTQLEGDKAREEAFDRFAFDLSRGREWTYSLLPDIGEVLSLIKPTLPFADVFRLLETHLEEFREYKSGKPLALPAGAGACAEQVLSELYVRAIDVGVSALTQQARLALRETAEVAGGTPITVCAIESLWSKGGNAALEAVRIAWDCRDIDGVRDALCEKLQSWASNQDIAVQRTVDMLAQHWAVEIEAVQHELPAFYSLELPPDEVARHFDKPLGFRDDDEGMWSEDPNRWTWTLELPLQTLSRASPFSVETLRRRTAQLMAQNGGKDAFGPSTTKRRKARMSRLGLRLPYNRPMAYAAMLAVRQVAGELRMAGALDYREVAFFILDAGGFNPTTDTAAPHPRPVGCVKPRLSTFFSGRHDENKAASKGADDTAVDRFPDWICLAAITRYERTRFNEVLAVDRLAVPAISMDEAESLDDAYTSLKCALVAGIAYPIYRDAAKGAVVSFRDDAAGSFPEYGLGLCPVAAAHAGAKVDRQNPFIWLDGKGSLVARTIWWREGGFRADDTDDTLRGHGAMLLARASFVKELGQATGAQLRVSAWRNLSHRRNGSQSASVSHRLHKISYSS